jgi:hypothetical protein
MKIAFERSGGFAALTLSADFDTDMLPEDIAQALDKLVTTAEFFDLPAQFSGNPGAADLYQYTITVDDGLRVHTVTTTEGAAPTRLGALINYLDMLARKRNRGV